VTGSDVKQCCAAFYGSDLARALLGESFHPGGVTLTSRLGELLGLGPESRVLDVACGRGTSAFHLAARFGCSVLGVDLSEENVRLAAEESASREKSDAVQFCIGDAEKLPFEDGSFDAVVCECAFCTFPSKEAAAAEFFRVLKPGGAVGLSDLTRSDGPMPELEGLLAWVACIADAQPLERYVALFSDAGFRVEATENWDGTLVDMVRQVQGRLMEIEVLAGLKKLDAPGLDLTAAKEFADAALRAIREGRLGYQVVLARKVARSA